ncbi:hypothetical protein MSG28_011196 [Choristoneura fumiferana]|uniref:Uncharacterized protein n=1 Tax=Choristoneura fumiferana TaxID=7141 RepID=A0ACC0KRC1_CHOFU|nr:hypothetical protein MSG28_011196 [Choristoneura fumiferana]
MCRKDVPVKPPMRHILPHSTVNRAKEQEKKIQMRMIYLQEYNERMRKERAERAREKQNRIKQRVQAAAEMELRRKITMVRQWRTNEKKRLARVKHEREAKAKYLESEANRKWSARVSAQNHKIQEEALLLKLYTEDMNAGAARRAKKADIYAYVTDLELQRIRLANWKLLHGGNAKAAQLVRKMGEEFERSKRGAKGMSLEFALSLAHEAMNNAWSTEGDTLMTLGQARARMDVETVLPSAPVRLLEEILETTVMEFARQRTHLLMRDVERVVRGRAATVFFQNFRPAPKKRSQKPPRWSAQVATEMARQNVNVRRGAGIAFGDVRDIPNEEEAEHEMKRARDRPPTPVVWFFRLNHPAPPRLKRLVFFIWICMGMRSLHQLRSVTGSPHSRVCHVRTASGPLQDGGVQSRKCIMDDWKETAHIVPDSHRLKNRAAHSAGCLGQSFLLILIAFLLDQLCGMVDIIVFNESLQAYMITMAAGPFYRRQYLRNAYLKLYNSSNFKIRQIQELPNTVFASSCLQPSRTKLAEVTFSDRCEDLPDPVALGTFLPERRKMLEMINVAARLMSRSVSEKVLKGLDIIVGTVTLPNMRHPMEWGEAVEGLASAVVDNRVNVENADVRRTSEFLAHRILRSLLLEMKEEKRKRKESIASSEGGEAKKDFYDPNTATESGKESPNK